MAWDFTFRISGEGFRPSDVGFKFTDQHDAGEIATSGRWKGKGSPLGSASYQVPPSVPHCERLKCLADIFEPMLPRLRAAGATDWEVWIIRYYHAQCNEEFSADELRHMLRLNCPFCYSAASVSEEEETELRKELGYL